MNRRIDPSDFLLGELTDSERAEAERMLREEADFREQVERLQPIVSELRDLPPEAWRLSEQDEERVVRSTPRPAPRRRMRLALASAAACAALVGAGVGIGALIFSGGEKASTSASTVVLRPVTPRASTASGTARLDEANSEATLQVRGLPQRPDLLLRALADGQPEPPGLLGIVPGTRLRVRHGQGPTAGRPAALPLRGHLPRAGERRAAAQRRLRPARLDLSNAPRFSTGADRACVQS